MMDMSADIKENMKLILDSDDLTTLDSRVYLAYNYALHIITDVFEGSPLINSIRLGMREDGSDFELIIMMDKLRYQEGEGVYRVDLENKYCNANGEDIVLDFDTYQKFTNTKISGVINDTLPIVDANKLFSILDVFKENKNKLFGVFNKNKGNFNYDRMMAIGSFSDRFTKVFFGVYDFYIINRDIDYREQSKEVVRAEIEKMFLKKDSLGLAYKSNGFKV